LEHAVTQPALENAPGRLHHGNPVAIVDIGSNSVRLVVYEGLTRAPTPIFNEKVMCGLGRNVATKGRLNEDAMQKALKALARFRILCASMSVRQTFVLATAAARDAANGLEFLEKAELACGQHIELLTGEREAQLSALGVMSGFHRVDGVVGDFGGGSLELVDISADRIGSGVSLPIGGLALQDKSGGNIRKADKIVREALHNAKPIEALRGRTFYAVGGTWRALAKLHMTQRGYPLHVMHGYALQPRDLIEYANIVERVDSGSLESIESVAEPRRNLLAYGAVALEEIVRRGRPKEIVLSALGVREGVLYELLDKECQRSDPLLSAAGDLNFLRSRSPRHGHDLVKWTDAFMASSNLDETDDERRLRHAACLLADIGWRAHPDYRGEQSLNVIAHAAFVGIDHPQRAFLALSVFFRHMGLSMDAVSPRIRELVNSRALDRARVLGGAMRVAYLISASMPDVLPRTPLKIEDRKLTLSLPQDWSDLANERLYNRLRQLAKLIGREPSLVTV
jgi:exopolyphosphatase / guanosine-5'-triphosphate,3'-diphosphate pyrophosphatase